MAARCSMPWHARFWLWLSWTSYLLGWAKLYERASARYVRLLMRYATNKEG